jgi:hypothetical protein
MSTKNFSQQINMGIKMQNLTLDSNPMKNCEKITTKSYKQMNEQIV